MNNYLTATILSILSCALALTLLVLSAVSLGSIRKMDKTKTPSEEDLKNAERSSTGLVVISVVLALMCAFNAWDQFKPAKQQSIYYF
jgi:hypothetical protein